MKNVDLEDDRAWIDLWNQYQSPVKMSKILNISVRNIYTRRRRLEERYGIKLKAINIYNFDINKYVIDFINTTSNLMDLKDNFKLKMISQNREHIKKNYLWGNICRHQI